MATKGAVLDTSAYSHISKDNQTLLSLLKSFERIVLPLNALAELRSGYRLGSKETDNLHILDKFMSQPQVGTMIPDEETLEQYVELHTIARQHARTLSHNDLWIAAVTRQLGYDLVTFDNDFVVFKELFGDQLHILKTPKP